MAVKNILVLGGGGHAKSVISVIKKIKRFRVIGYVDVHDQGRILEIPWIGCDKDLSTLKKKYRCSAALGIGTTSLSNKRQEIVAQLTDLGFQLPLLVSPTAIVNEDVRLGEGTVVFDSVVVNAGTRVGEYSILNTGCLIDHDCCIGNFVHIAPGAVLSGGVKVADNCLLGTGVKVIQCCSIASDCLIGAGAVVVRNIEKAGIYMGVPAYVRKHSRK